MSGPTASALVLAAGLGTRLRPLTCVRAKAAAPVAGIPLIGRVLSGLARSEVRDVVVNLHHLPATITAVVGDGSGWHVRVRYSWEHSVLGSAGGPRHALPLLSTDPFLIVNADTLTDVDVRALLASHAASGARVTLAVVENPAPHQYGGVVVDGEGAVRGFTRAGDPRPSYHFVGVQVAAKSVFAGLDDGRPAESLAGVYRSLIAHEPGAVRAAVFRASFSDIGTPRDYLSTSLELARAEGHHAPPAGRCRVAPDARLERTAVWDDVTIGPGCELVECVVADGVNVPANTRLTGHVLVPPSSCAAAAGAWTRDGFAAVVIGGPIDTPGGAARREPSRAAEKQA